MSTPYHKLPGSLGTLQQRLRRYRHSAGLTYRQLEEVAGVSKSALHSFCQGHERPHELTLARLRRHLPSLFDGLPDNQEIPDIREGA